jgi:ABC-type Fe2+-enterobactin transport system substrate-binding protein
MNSGAPEELAVPAPLVTALASDPSKMTAATKNGYFLKWEKIYILSNTDDLKCKV